ncbi:hypothetical protein NVIE_0714 [Nitrososphaera viennensis EN76]|uniref:Uncharacterized protein n=1 Tax=Nitrososphaera viennensis EN76 TaxID=926571 RepID=A0A060HMZ8_9ARCH|nr:hypothetical protein NVIE_0714 [Nitrososphaera viennensis EN76]
MYNFKLGHRQFFFYPKATEFGDLNFDPDMIY